MSNYNRYTIIAFIPDREKPVKWNSVYSLKSAAESLTRLFPDWIYMNVYERGTRNYLKRLYRENDIPKFI